MAVCKSWEEVICGTMTSLHAKLLKSSSQQEFVFRLVVVDPFVQGCLNQAQVKL